MKRSQSRSYIKKTEREKKDSWTDYQSWLYRTEFWLHFRKAYLQKNPECEECKRCHIVRSAVELDHIKRLKYNITFDEFVKESTEDKVQALCVGHHNQKKAQERNELRRRK